jgi:uncharacterized protein YcfL
MRKMFMLIGVTLLLLLGCSSPTDPSDDAFKQLAEEYKTITIPLVATVEQ